MISQEQYKLTNPSEKKLEKNGFRKNGDGYICKFMSCNKSLECEIQVEPDGNIRVDCYDLNHFPYSLFYGDSINKLDIKFLGSIENKYKDIFRKVGIKKR